MEVTAVAQADTNRLGAGEGHSVKKRTIGPDVNAQMTLCPSRRGRLGSESITDPTGVCPFQLYPHNISLETAAGLWEINTYGPNCKL